MRPMAAHAADECIFRGLLRTLFYHMILLVAHYMIEIVETWP